MRRAVGNWLWPNLRQARAIQWLTALGMAVSAGMLGLGAMILIDARADAWHQAEQASSNLLLALSRDIARNISFYDLSLQGVRTAITLPDLDTLRPEMRQLVLFDRAAMAEYLGALAVLDENGNILIDSTSAVPHKLNFADRDYFSYHQARPEDRLYISRAYRNALRGGDPSVAVTRRITKPDGSFGGVVSGTLRLAYFQDLFGKLDLGTAGSVTIFRSDGRIVMRRPFREEDLDRDLGQTALFQSYMAAEAGILTGTGTLDGVRRMYAFRHVNGLPLVLSVAVAVDDVYAAWRRKALGIGAVLTLLCGMTVVLSVLFRQAMLRRLEAERELRTAAEKMAVIATTDALTNLSNRRAFEERLAQEYLRSIRTESPISLLMLDADYFKRFNDHYGHPAGDRALQAIAACIASNVLRPGDIGARYGGEEFIVLLPDTDLMGALVVAERIRVAVTDKAIKHTGNPPGWVTVSIGVAVAYPMVGDDPAELVSLADAALYEAKDSGRNRISGLGIPASSLIDRPIKMPGPTKAISLPQALEAAIDGNAASHASNGAAGQCLP